MSPRRKTKINKASKRKKTTSMAMATIETAILRKNLTLTVPQLKSIKQG